MRMYKIIIASVLTATIIAAVIYLVPKSLNSRLDDLERIIQKYEPRFESIEYGTPDYKQMAQEYNDEITKWSEEFEIRRYEKDKQGNFIKSKENYYIPNNEFKKVEKRFFELNNRMTKMVLSNHPGYKKNSRNK
jgi:hypothetical protein